MCEMRVYFVIAIRIEIDILRVTAKSIGGFAELDFGVVEQFEQWRQPIVNHSQFAQLRMGATECATQGKLTFAIEQFDDPGGAFSQPSRSWFSSSIR